MHSNIKVVKFYGDSVVNYELSEARSRFFRGKRGYHGNDRVAIHRFKRWTNRARRRQNRLEIQLGLKDLCNW